MTTDLIAAARAMIEPLTGYTLGPWRYAEEVDPHCFDTRIEDLHGHELAFCDPEDARLIAASPDMRDMVATLADALEAERAEVERLTKGSICEVAATNPSAMEYMRHWEERAEKAETERDTLVAAAYEAAVDACDEYPRVAPDVLEWSHYDDQIAYSQASIRALTPADAQAALDKLLAEARLEGWRAGRDAAESVIGHYMTTEDDELLCDMWREDIRALPEPKEAEK